MDQHFDSSRNSLSQSDNGRKRLADLVREAIRTRSHSRRTGKTYWYWIRYFIFFNGKRHPMEMGAAEVSAFLSWLATERDVAAATQNQALHALLFLFISRSSARNCHGWTVWCAPSARRAFPQY